MPKRKSSSKVSANDFPQLLQLKISLRYIQPEIWRQVIVPDNLTLGDLHDIIQIVMGWTDSHLHIFKIGSRNFGMADEDGTFEACTDENSVLLRDTIAKKGLKFIYEYDFGDGWLHDIRVDKVIPGTDLDPLPECLGGERACPPEDCGGPPGYENVLRVVKRASTPDDRELLKWLGKYDPDSFDLTAINKFFRG